MPSNDEQRVYELNRSNLNTLKEMYSTMKCAAIENSALAEPPNDCDVMKLIEGLERLQRNTA